MLRTYDVYCEYCGYYKEDHLCEKDDLGECPSCNHPLKRLYSALNFKLKYNPKTDVCAWASEGYASSQYWRDVKKQKEETGKTPNHRGSCDLPE